jgi:hypothetical protein
LLRDPAGSNWLSTHSFVDFSNLGMPSVLCFCPRDCRYFQGSGCQAANAILGLIPSICVILAHFCPRTRHFRASVHFPLDILSPFGWGKKTRRREEQPCLKRRCPFCHRLFIPDPRVKERQNTCGRQDCRREQKRQLDERWRSQN